MKNNFHQQDYKGTFCTIKKQRNTQKRPSQSKSLQGHRNILCPWGCDQEYSWPVPVLCTCSNQQGTFQQPFNQYGIHPSYKWAKAHIGYTSMTFSPYTLSGHQFLGMGIELAPNDRFKFSRMYGRLQKAVGHGTASASTEPAYLGFGHGMKGSGKSGETNVDVIRAAPFPEKNRGKGKKDGQRLLQAALYGMNKRKNKQNDEHHRKQARNIAIRIGATA